MVARNVPAPGRSPWPVLAVIEGLLDKRAHMGPPFNKTRFLACLYLKARGYDSPTLRAIQTGRHVLLGYLEAEGRFGSHDTAFKKANALLRP